MAAEGRFLSVLRDVSEPFIHPRNLQRRRQTRTSRDWPELDTLRLEVTAGDHLRLQALVGTVTVEELRELGSMARPSLQFLDDVDSLVELGRRLREGPR